MIDTANMSTPLDFVDAAFALLDAAPILEIVADNLPDDPELDDAMRDIMNAGDAMREAAILLDNARCEMHPTRDLADLILDHERGLCDWDTVLRAARGAS